MLSPLDVVASRLNCPLIPMAAIWAAPSCYMLIQGRLRWKSCLGRLD
jgi:hypothetical protein